MPNPRSEQVNIRLDASEMAAIDGAAEKAGLARSEWIRLVLRHAAGMRDFGKQLERAKTR